MSASTFRRYPVPWPRGTGCPFRWARRREVSDPKGPSRSGYGRGRFTIPASEQAHLARCRESPWTAPNDFPLPEARGFAASPSSPILVSTKHPCLFIWTASSTVFMRADIESRPAWESDCRKIALTRIHFKPLTQIQPRIDRRRAIEKLNSGRLGS